MHYKRTQLSQRLKNLIQTNEHTKQQTSFAWIINSPNRRLRRELITNDANQGKITHLEGSGGEFDSDCGFGLQAKLIPGIPRENVGFPNTRVSDQDDLEKIIVLVVHSMSHNFPSLLSSLDFSN